MRRTLALLMLAVFPLAACSEETPEPATIRQVVQQLPVTEPGSRFDPALPDEAIVVDANITDVRTGPPLLVELTSGGEWIWVEGVTDRPQPQAGVAPALLGSARPDDQLGLIYPSTGPVDPSLALKGGWAPEGALGVMIGAVALGVLLAVGIAAAVRGSLANRRCPSCDFRMRPAWQTCPSCGKAVTPLGVQPAPVAAFPPPANPTILTDSATPPAAPVAAFPPSPVAQPATEPTDRGTRIVRE
nr:zinc ribbon domain-containing protein [uncultured Candidatus Microthrix sp.]